MRPQSLFILILLLAGLGTYIYYGIQKPAERAATDGAGEKVYNFDASEIEAVKIENSAAQLELKKDEKGWRLTSPVQDIASESKMKTFISSLQKLRKTKELQKTELETFGLKPPKVKLGLKLRSKSDWTDLSLGNQNPSSSATYALLPGMQKVSLVSLDLDFLSTQKLEDFREMNLSSVDSERYDLVKLESKGKNLVFKKMGGNWTMTEPPHLPIDAESIRSFVEKVGLIRANVFLEKAPENKPADLILTVGFQEGVQDLRTDKNDTRPFGTQIQLLKLKSKKSSSGTTEIPYEYFAKSDKTPWASISQFHYENLHKPYENFVRKTFDDFLVTDIEKAKFELPGATGFQIERKNNVFQISQGKNTKTGNFSKVEEALRNLRGMRALSYLQEVAQPPQIFSLKIELQLKNSEKRAYVFNFKKDQTELFSLYQNRWLKYVLAKDALKPEQFDFKKLTDSSATPLTEKKADDSEKKE